MKKFLATFFKGEKISDDDFLALVQEGSASKVVEAIRRGANVNAKNEYGATALMAAAVNGHTEIVNALIKAGADVNTKDSDGETALMQAAFNGHTETVNVLIEAGADDAIDNYGRTALIHAAAWGTPEAVEALIEAGSYVKQRDKGGKTALDYARDNPKFKGSPVVQRLEQLSR